MTKLQKLSFIILLPISLFTSTAKCQENNLPAIASDYFRNPLAIPLYLAGNFGELRSNHFHSGLDIKTNQREGLPVYATADGYVSRLRVQIGGFGNALYINHPNGVTSVYAHLQKFDPLIEARVKAFQYEKQSFPIDVILTPIEIRVKKGDIIAYSGNTGGSAGPHLHFELRNTKTEETINPITLGIKIKDTTKPQMSALYIYKTNKTVFNEHTPKQYFAVYGSNGIYNLGKVGTIAVNGEFGLGITAFDQQDGSANHNGVFSTTIKLDGEIIYECVIDKFAFENSRAINAYIDYYSKLSSGRVIQKGFIAESPKIKFIKAAKNRGLMELTDQATHKIEYVLKDVEGNESVLTFNVKNNATISNKPFDNKGLLMSYKTVNKYETSEVKMSLPVGVLYNDLYFDYAEKAQPSYAISKIYQLHNKFTPLHNPFELAIKVDSSKLNYADKLIIYQLETGSQGGVFKDGYILANPKTFGNFCLRADTVAPVISAINVNDGANLSKQSVMTFKISDSLSGIKSFNGYIDNQWVLMEYDSRNGKLWHTFDEKTGFGKHLFKLVVTDNKENSKTYQITFYR
ncbi:M23 family metallopeptidase [Pedobacter arcticus]|uniref:M23 family metallopeptidase n=1 Tax=Pedobacter arcticus TaxID=752140 RepID=UPI0002D2CA45|nr:M23 family metallopeptidase [Pedobacter arcticus]